jgi:predicted ester cyclase
LRTYRIIALAFTFSTVICIISILSGQQKHQSVLGEILQEKNNNTTIHMNKLIVVALTQAFNDRNITALDKLVAVNEIEHDLLVHKGLAELKQYFSNLIYAFPDLHITIDHIVAEGNKVAVITNTTGTPERHLMATTGIPIPEKKISFKSADIYRIANNKIVEHWNIVESVKMLDQLGAIKFNVPKNHS